MKNLEPIITLEPGWRRRPDLYANIPVPVLQVPTGKEGEPGGFPNFLKEEEKEEYNEEKEMMEEEDEEEKRENDVKEDAMEGKRRDEETACWWRRALHCTLFPCIYCYRFVLPMRS